MCEKNLEQRGIRMEQYKVILVDDEAEVIDIMEAKIRWSELGFEVVGSAKNGVKALELVEKLQPDVVLTDIRMPYMDGLELSRKLNQDYPNIYIILCTGFDEFEYAKEAVHLDIKEYLLKPISYPDFLKAANKALQWYEHMQAPAAEIESIFIKTEYKQVQVELRKILYIEGLKDYVKIFIEDEPHPILSLMSMKSLEEMLPASRFIRVHRSFIVQPEKIKVIERNRIVFGKEYIPISDNYKPRLVEFLAQRSLNFN